MTHFQYIKNFHWQQEKSRKTASLGKAADKPRLNPKEPPKILPSPRLTCRIANFIGKVLENPPEIYEKSHYQKALKRGIIPVVPGIPIAHTKLTWGFLSRSLCALVCGPVMGLVFGFVEDILGFILHPTGEFFPGYTLSTMAGVLVYALCFFRRRITVVRLIAANLLVNLLVNAAMGSVWSTMVRGGVYWGWFIPSLAKNLVTVLPKAAALYFLFQALLPILQRMGLIPRQVDGAIRLI